MQCVNYCEIVKLFRFSTSQSWCFGIRVSVSEALTFGKLRSRAVSLVRNLTFDWHNAATMMTHFVKEHYYYCSYKKSQLFSLITLLFMCTFGGSFIFSKHEKLNFSCFGWKLESSPAIKRNEYMRKSCCILYNTGGH